MILADTSIWIDHFRHGTNGLRDLLNEGQVAIHPFVIGELACGSLKDRALILTSLNTLPPVRAATHGEVIALLDQHKLWGLGLGWVDVHLLASTLLSNCRLWSGDDRLAKAAKRLRCAVVP